MEQMHSLLDAAQHLRVKLPTLRSALERQPGQFDATRVRRGSRVWVEFTPAQLAKLPAAWAAYKADVSKRQRAHGQQLAKSNAVRRKAAPAAAPAPAPVPPAAVPALGLRDYFAAHALAAVLNWNDTHDTVCVDPAEVAAVAANCYDIADAMLEARKAVANA